MTVISPEPAQSPAEPAPADPAPADPAAASVALRGSHRTRVAALDGAGPADPTQIAEITLVLRRRAPLPDRLVTGRETVDAAGLAAGYGAAPEDVDAVTRVLMAAGLTVTEVEAGARRIVAAGPVGALSTLFGTELVQAAPATGAANATETETGTQPATGTGAQTGPGLRYRSGELHLPTALDGIVTAVLGLDERPQARTRHRVARAAKQTSYTVPQLGEVYGFPPEATGAGQTVAIIELGGGFGTADLKQYFTGLGLAVPTVTAVGVDGGRNVVGKDPDGADGEVLLDIEVVGALAGGADIAVYFGPNTDRGFLDAITTAVHATPTPVAVSISWGGPEDSWTAQARAAMDDAFADAAALGVTVTAAAGDNGSADGATDGSVHADFPASSPHALACGGTSLTADPTTGKVTREVVWSTNGATGGGVSAEFAQPTWQAAAGVPNRPAGGTGRGVPDVAADADPATGYDVVVDGQSLVIGGTSAVAPLWAALTARLVQTGGKPLGLLAPLLYAGIAPGATPAGFRDITSGSNGAYKAAKGWDPCTGLGVPEGTALAARLFPTTPPTAPPTSPPTAPPVTAPAT